jgi:cholesterol transport system auxiliary component
MKAQISRRAALVRSGLWLGGLGVLGGCATSLLPTPPQPPTLYALDDASADRTSTPIAPYARTILVTPPRAAAGFDTRGIVYLRQAHAFEVYAYSQWVDTPAQMLAPQIVHALETTGAFRAVLLAPLAVNAELRLDTELVRLQQDFTVAPSRVRLTLRAVLVETATRRVVAWRKFDASVAAPSEDAYGGVRAANQAVTTLLAEMAAFVAQAAAR